MDIVEGLKKWLDQKRYNKYKSKRHSYDRELDYAHKKEADRYKKAISNFGKAVTRSSKNISKMNKSLKKYKNDKELLADFKKKK